MLPTGMSFTGVSHKALAAHATAKLHRYYFDWTMMADRPQKSFIGTIPVNIFYGLRESIRLLQEEGLDNVVARHARLGEATRRAVRVWAGNDGPSLFCTNPDRYSDSVTAILMPDGVSGDALRKVAREKYNVSLGGGLGKLGGKIFRIGHLGDLNEPMLLGALASRSLTLGRQDARTAFDGAPQFIALQPARCGEAAAAYLELEIFAALVLFGSRLAASDPSPIALGHALQDRLATPPPPAATAPASAIPPR
jgi:aspartate aminotransferase-like enzyme